MTPAVLPPAVEPKTKADPVEVLEVRLQRFCGEVGRIIDAEGQSFEPLRRESIDRQSWTASLIPDGLIECTIDGKRRPLAIYECRSQPLAGSHQGLLDQTFNDTLADIDFCLQQTVWYPKEWRRGQVIEFGRGEKQITWRDIKSSPRPIVSLHIEEDFAKRVHYLRLAFGTLN